MPIITQIGRKSWNLRILIWSIYALLTAGAVTMIYPFTMMVSLSLSSYADFKENRIIPRYFHSEDALFRKFAAVKYDFDGIDRFNMRHRSRYPSFDYGQFQALASVAAEWPRIVAVPFDLSDPRIEARIADYNEWKREFISDHWFFTECQYLTTRAQSTANPLLDRYLKFLIAKYGSLEGVNRAYYEENRELRDIFGIKEWPTMRTYLPDERQKTKDWQEFKKQLAEENLEFINIGNIEAEWGKFLQSKYNGEEVMNAALGTDYVAFYSVPLPFTAPADGPSERDKLLRSLWTEFVRNRVPLRYMEARDPDARYRKFLGGKYETVERLNEAHGTSYGSLEDVEFPSEISYNSVATADAYLFVGSDALAPEDITIRSPRWYWTEFLRGKYGTLEEANKAHSISYADWQEVGLARRLPRHQTRVEQGLWRAFVLEACPVESLLGNFEPRRMAEFFRGEYPDIDSLNSAWGTRYDDFEDIRSPKPGELSEAEAADLHKMLKGGFVPLSVLAIPESVDDSLYRDFLKGRYASIAEYNNAIRLYTSWDDTHRPIDEVEYADFAGQRDEYMKSFITGNYKAVVEYLVSGGNSRAFYNTAILCAAMVLAALTVNPLCAYALSRFQLGYANSILLFLLATMAFPVAVTQIPNFLMLKNMGMLNTYWALILPGLANGYSIFLLKGFFDSLPQELFEAGLIDGASEVQMFYRIALPLTTPILAVIALGAFTLSYGQFMWAFVVCQNPKYWTIMVFLFQFQQDYAVPLVMAGLVLASLPTLIVFIAAQKVILRGIVVPQMK